MLKINAPKSMLRSFVAHHLLNAQAQGVESDKPMRIAVVVIDCATVTVATAGGARNGTDMGFGAGWLDLELSGASSLPVTKVGSSGEPGRGHVTEHELFDC